MNLIASDVGSVVKLSMDKLDLGEFVGGTPVAFPITTKGQQQTNLMLTQGQCVTLLLPMQRWIHVSQSQLNHMIGR